MRVVLGLTLVALLWSSVPGAAQAPALAVGEVFGLVQESPASFARMWERRYSTAAKDARGEALAELRAARARGYIDYAYFRWRETGRAVPETWAPRRRAEAAVDINDVTGLDRREHRAFLEAWLRAAARRRLATDRTLQTGDNRWLRARFAVAESRVQEPVVRRRLLHDALARHIEDNGVRGIPELVDRYAALTGAEAGEVATLRAAVAEGLAASEGHRIDVYKTVDGVALEAHVFAPEGAETRRPALIWFHGGSWASGTWAHCPTVCRVARERGYVVVQIEYRTDDRFAAGPLAVIDDARDAVTWVRTQAGALGVDPTRVVVAGFSSGGTVAALLATTAAAGNVRGAVVMSACVAPLRDSWFRRMTERRAREVEVTPAAHLDQADPPTLAVHGDADEMCPYADTAAFVDTARDAGVDAELLTIEAGTHFFVFRSPAARARTAEAIARFLERRR